MKGFRQFWAGPITLDWALEHALLLVILAVMLIGFPIGIWKTAQCLHDGTCTIALRNDDR